MQLNEWPRVAGPEREHNWNPPSPTFMHAFERMCHLPVTLRSKPNSTRPPTQVAGDVTKDEYPSVLAVGLFVQANKTPMWISCLIYAVFHISKVTKKLGYARASTKNQ
jgi:hypothetical protein